MGNQGKYVKQTATLVIALSFVALSSLGGADSRRVAAPIPDEDLFFRCEFCARVAILAKPGRQRFGT